jgi:hypothetical protein
MGNLTKDAKGLSGKTATGSKTRQLTTKTTTTKGYKMETVKIGKAFLDDHRDRDLPMPNIVKETKRNYYIQIDWDNEGYADLYSDSMYYSNPSDFDSFYFGLCMAARALAKQMTATK